MANLKVKKIIMKDIVWDSGENKITLTEVDGKYTSLVILIEGRGKHTFRNKDVDMLVDFFKDLITEEVNGD